MQALGLIETRGLLAAIEGADTMLKSADVSILEKTYVGGGLVSIAVTGDVGAVKAAVEAGVAAVKKLDSKLLISEHVIPRPHDELDNIIGIKKSLKKLEVSSESENEICENLNEVVEIEVIKNEISEKEETIETIDCIDTKSEKINLAIDNSLPKNLKEEHSNDSKVDLNNLQKATVDNLVNESGIEKTLKILSNVKVAKLRELARQYKDFKVTEGKISKASKKLLITKFRAYYE
ncbi:BMC domain-containing protein [Clostridium botulinum]|uniref:BMC domain-containing protein n=1 Tax=unclassified Clostridium TaxID=2614128 RepID=UPI0013F01E3D|nr:MULTISPECIES: BMC domain-containing protein [unclassified Clostridium]NFG40517.1 BMC domain-containing protein [Clostridium botulinum]NFI04221.1 BMC domain-containing protein [Clostridium botulinum]